MGFVYRAFGSLLWGCVLAFFAARADAQEPCRARLMPPIEPELLRRIEGQVGDVSCALVLAGPAADAGAVASFVIEAQADGSYLVRVRPHDGRPEHVRPVRRAVEAKASGELARSALLEAVALVVRGELTELAASHRAQQKQAAERARQAAEAAARARQANAKPPGSTAATTGEQRDRENGDGEQREDDEADDEADSSEADGGRPASAIGLRLALGAELALAEDTTPAFGLDARVLFELGEASSPWLLGAGGTFGLPYALESERAELSVRRHTGRVYVGRGFDAADGVVAWHVLGSLIVRVADRATEVRDASLMATSDAPTTGGGAGVELGFALRPVRALSIELAIGFDATLFGTPRFAYESASGEREPLTDPAPLQPRAAAMLELRL